MGLFHLEPCLYSHQLQNLRAEIEYLLKLWQGWNPEDAIVAGLTVARLKLISADAIWTQQHLSQPKGTIY